MTKKIAIISDIHGNTWALEEVLTDIKNRGIETIINLGDSLYGPLNPKGTFKLLIKNEVISISGNEDRIILETLNLRSEIPTIEYVKSQIDVSIIDWLKKLPFDFIYDNEIYCCHASPKSDSVYLLDSLQPKHVEIRGNSEINKLLTGIKQKIVVCGHSHVSRVVETDKVIVINPGSVGLPAYEDDLPILHKMENFSSHARYSILTYSENSINIDQIAVSYNYEKTAKMAERNKRIDWAKWIRTGRV